MNKKKRIIAVILAGVFLLVFNPYVIETGREIYRTLYMAKYFLPGVDIPLLLSPYHPGQNPEDYLRRLLGEPVSQNNREELILSLHNCVEMPVIFDLGAEKTIGFTCEAVSKYPEDPMLRWLLVNSLVRNSTFLNPEFLEYKLKQGQYLDPEAPVFNYIGAYLKKTGFDVGTVREDVLEEINKGNRKPRAPGYQKQLSEMALSKFQRDLPSKTFILLAPVMSVNSTENARLRDLARYLSWTSGYYLQAGETEKALSAAHAAEDLGRQLYKSNKIIDILVGKAIEAIGSARTRVIYQSLDNHSGIEELRFASMRNHLWTQSIRQDLDSQMLLLVGYMAVWMAFLIFTFILTAVIFGYIASMIFYCISKKKIGGSFALSPARKKTYLFIGLSWLFSLFIGSLPVYLFFTSVSAMEPAVLSGAVILYLLLLYLLTGLSARGEGIYQGHRGSRFAVWSIIKTCSLPLLKYTIIVYILLMPVMGMYLSRYGDYFIETATDEAGRIPRPHVDREVYVQEMNRLVEIAVAEYTGKSGDESKRSRQLEAISYLGRVDAYETVPQLARILEESEDEKVRKEVIKTLGEFSRGVSPRVLEPFITEDEAISALGRINHPDAWEMLLEVYGQKELYIERPELLAWALARQGESASAFDILKQIADEPENVTLFLRTVEYLPRDEGVRILNMFYEKERKQRREYSVNALRKACTGELAGKLLQVMIEDNRIFSEDFFEIFSNHLNQSHVPLLAEGSKKGNILQLRNFCLYMLGHLGSGENIETIKESIDDKDWTVRLNAVCAIGQIKDESSLPLLEDIAVGDISPAVRSAASWSIEIIQE